MELKDFIAQTISQVMEGVIEAQKLAEKFGGAVNPKGMVYLTTESAPAMHKETTKTGDFIQFDVEVEVAEGKAESGGAKIAIPSVGGFGGKRFRKTKDRSINRDKFRLPVIYPKGTYKEEEKTTSFNGSPASSSGLTGIDSSASNVITVDATRKSHSTTDE